MKKRLLTFILSLFVFSAVIAGTSWVFAYEARAAVSSDDYSLSGNSVMAVGTKQELQVVLRNGADADKQSFTSSNTSVATVTSDGVVTANRTGSATITYSPDGNSKKSVSITVKAMPTSISISATSKTLNEGQSFSLNGSVESSAYQTPVYYSSSDSSVATVVTGGKVTAVGEGKAVITAFTENGLRAYCTVYVYDNNAISLNQKATKIAMDYDNVEKIVYGTSVRGRNLEAFVIEGNGNNSKTIFCTFAVHGFEDSYAKDGKVLVEAANNIIEYFAENPEKLRDYRLVVVPCGNPDGTIDGVNNLRSGSNAFGRCTAAHVDMNRDFISGKFKGQESRALRDLMKQYKMNIYLDIHGWLNTVLGDSGLVDIFRSTNGLSRDQSGSYGTSQGYIIGWAKENLGARSALVELRSPSSANYRNIAKGIEQAVSGSYHSSDYDVAYSDSISWARNLRVTENTDRSVSLRWDSVSGAKGYAVEYQYNGAWHQYTDVFGQNSVTLGGLQSGALYAFRIRAFTYSGNVRTYSNSYSDRITCYTLPHKAGAPSAAARSVDGTEIKLTWGLQLDSNGYVIYMKSGSSWKKLAALEGNMTKYYTVTGLKSNTQYTFAVAAYRGSETNTSTLSNSYTTYTACDIPSDFDAVAIDPSRIEVTWDKVSSSGYYIQWATNSSFTQNADGCYIYDGNATEYTINTKQFSKNYYVRVRAFRTYSSETIYGAFTETVSTKNSLFRADGIKITARGGDGERAKIEWNAVDGAVRYEVYEITNGVNRLKGETTDTNFTFTDLVPGWTYEVKIIAYGSDGRTSESEGYTFGAACPTVQNLKATITGMHSIQAEWDVTTSHGYRLEWSTSADFSKDVNGTYISGTNSTSYTIKTEKPADQYYVRVRAYKLLNGSTIYGAFSKPVSLAGQLLPVTGVALTARGGDGERARIDWNAVNGAVRYEVYEITNGINRLKGETTDTNFTFTDLVPGWTYEVKVVAYNAAGESSESEGYTFGAACPTVQNLKASVTDTNTIEAQWDVTTSHGYRLEWSTSADFSKDVNGTYISGTNSTSYTIKTEKPADQYYVRVRAYKLFQDTTIYGAFTQPIDIMGIEITARGGDGERARIDWNDAEDAVRYEVYEITNGINRLKGNTIDPYFTFTDLVPGWTYEVKVVAYNADDEKLFESEGYTFGAACPTVQNLKASVTGTNTIEAQWDVTTSHGYRLEWSTSADFSKDVNGTYISGTNSTSYTIKTEKPADQYYVRVRAYKLFNDSTIYGAFTQPVGMNSTVE